MGKWAGWLAIVIITTRMVAVFSAQPSNPPFEEIVQRMAAVNSPLESFRVEQEIVASVLLFRFVFSASVSASRPARYHVVLHNPPWPFSTLGKEFGQAARPEDVLAQYAPRAIGWKDEDGRQWLSLALEGRNRDVNPPRLEALVDPSKWLVGKTNFHYAWGDLLAEYRYGLYERFYLPNVLLVRAPSMFLSAAITHHDYQLNVAIPEEVFVKK